jgi:hypothetical protein
LKIEYLDKATYKIALADGVVRRMDRTSVVKEQGGEKKTAMTVTMNPAGLTEPGAHRFGELAEFYARSRQARSMRSKSAPGFGSSSAKYLGSR